VVSRVTYLWQGAKVSEEWRTGTEEGSTVEIDRWHYKPATFHPIAKETLARTEIDPFALAESRFYPVVTDQAGTPRELFNAEGDCVWQAEYSLWGEVSGNSAGSGASDTDCNLKFQGQWKDEESGLHYNLHRYYDPEIGQYLSSDPLGLGGGTRSYGYVRNPVSWTDPLGLAECGDAPQGARDLQARAKQLQSMRNEWISERGTTAVIRGTNPQTGQTVDFIATEGKGGMPPEWQGQLNPNEQFVRGSGHAEETILNSPETQGWDLTEGGTSRNVCSGTCEPLLQGRGLDVGGPEFPGNSDKTPNRMFWNQQ
jgi:RHS repeat-associated protein